MAEIKLIKYKKGLHIGKLEENHKFIDEIKEIKNKLVECKDCNVQNFV